MCWFTYVELNSLISKLNVVLVLTVFKLDYLLRSVNRLSLVTSLKLYRRSIVQYLYNLLNVLSLNMYVFESSFYNLRKIVNLYKDTERTRHNTSDGIKEGSHRRKKERLKERYRFYLKLLDATLFFVVLSLEIQKHSARSWDLASVSHDAVNLKLYRFDLLLQWSCYYNKSYNIIIRITYAICIR